MAFRTVRTIQNYGDGAVEEGDTDQDITVDYQYDAGGRLVTMTAYDAKGTGNGIQEQATKYLYESAIDASWQTAVVYPDSTDTLSQDPTTLVWTITAGSDHASTSYDQLGRTTETTDQRGVVHEYSFDSAGRPSADTVTDLGSTGILDGSIRRIGTAYDDIGRVQTVTSYSDTSGSTAVNQVEYKYNGWGKVDFEYQEHNGTVDANTPYVEYDYDDGASGGVAKYVRLTDVIYPNGRDVKYGYGQTQAIDDIMSRLASIGDGTNTYAAYRYLGAGDIVSEDYQQVSVKLDYSANNLTGLDRFARVADQVWASYGANPATLDEYTYSYDRAGNRTSRANAVDSALSELYGYNGVDELTSWSVNGIQQRTWCQDALGNDLSSGTYSAANEETPTQGSSGYDAAGNMTTLQSGQTAIYDAWDRLVEVDDASGIVEKFAYDGTNRRIQTSGDFTGSTPATVVDDYLAGQQVVESDVTTNGTRNGGYQYVWSPRYVDATVLRDTLTTDGTTIVAGDRVYYLSDANYNITALVKYDSGAGQWQVSERYTYDPYGVVTYRNPDWTTAASSANSNTVLYAGRSFDSLTSLYYNRTRYYDPGLERFISRDPIGFSGGDADLYRYVGNDPTNATDPSGLANLWNPLTWGISNSSQGWLGFLNPVSQESRAAVGGLANGYWDSAVSGQQASSLAGYSDSLTSSLNPFGGGTNWGPAYGQNGAYTQGRNVGGATGLAMNAVMLVSGVRGIITGIQSIRAAGGLIKVVRLALPDGGFITAVVANGQAIELTPAVAANLGISAAAVANLSQGGTALMQGQPGGTSGSAACTGELHHPFSAKVVRALNQHPTLKGHFQYHDPRYVTRAIDQASHEGYGKLFRDLDEGVAKWIRNPKNKTATPEEFLKWLRSVYNRPELKRIFPNGF